MRLMMMTMTNVHHCIYANLLDYSTIMLGLLIASTFDLLFTFLLSSGPLLTLSPLLHLTSVLLVDENVSVPSFSSLHADDSLVDVVEAILGGPSLDLVLGGKLENFSNILGRTDQ